jgi:predicted RNA binding protein YcfA (HicA-like mRNA interferase family)
MKVQFRPFDLFEVDLFEGVPPVKYRHAEKHLKKHGFMLKGEGNHEKWEHSDGRTLTLPNHYEVDGRTLRTALKNAKTCLIDRCPH